MNIGVSSVDIVDLGHGHPRGRGEVQDTSLDAAAMPARGGWRRAQPAFRAQAQRPRVARSRDGSEVRPWGERAC